MIQACSARRVPVPGASFDRTLLPSESIGVMQALSGLYQPVPSVLDWKYYLASIESTEAMRVSSGFQQQVPSAIAREYIPVSTESTLGTPELIETPELVSHTNARECVHLQTPQ
jgi:hypothetical protein